MNAYEVMPMIATPERANVISGLLRKIASFETVFNDHQRGCGEGCMDGPLVEMCPRCVGQMQLIASALLKPDARVFEVWKADEESAEIVGLVYFAHVVPGEDAVGHYVFFDGDLASKTTVLKDVIAWAFEDHEDWEALRRLTVEIPSYAFALAKHAHRKLGFGGPFEYETGGMTIPVEGVKRDRIRWRGRDEDLLFLGLTRENFMGESPQP